MNHTLSQIIGSALMMKQASEQANSQEEEEAEAEAEDEEEASRPRKIIIGNECISQSIRQSIDQFIRPTD